MVWCTWVGSCVGRHAAAGCPVWQLSEARGAQARCAVDPDLPHSCAVSPSECSSGRAAVGPSEISAACGDRATVLLALACVASSGSACRTAGSLRGASGATRSSWGLQSVAVAIWSGGTGASLAVSAPGWPQALASPVPAAGAAEGRRGPACPAGGALDLGLVWAPQSCPAGVCADSCCISVAGVLGSSGLCAKAAAGVPRTLLAGCAP